MKKIKTPPPHLDSYGREVWRACVEAGTVTDADRQVLLAYVSACIRLKTAMEILRAEGTYVTSETGVVRKHPAVDMEAQSRKDIGALSTKLKLNPEARLGRSRVEIEKRDEGGLLT